MSEFHIPFRRPGEIDRRLAHGVCYYLLSQGFSYNPTGNGRYSYIIEGEFENHDETGPEDGSEKVAAIFERFFEHNADSVSVTFVCDSNYEYWLTLSITRGENDGMVKLVTEESELESTNEYLSCVALCKGLFLRFGFDFGLFLGEEASVPRTRAQFLDIPTTNVSFYSSGLAERVGREKLLSAPAYKVEELRDGGVFLQICETPTNCSKTASVHEHLEFH